MVRVQSKDRNHSSYFNKENVIQRHIIYKRCLTIFKGLKRGPKEVALPVGGGRTERRTKDEERGSLLPPPRLRLRAHQRGSS